VFKMLGSTIDLGSLCVIVVVVVCSWGVALLCSLTCWNSYKKSQPSHLYCTQCSTLAGPPLPVTIPVTIPPLQYYHQQQINPHHALPHTAERLGILDSGEQHPAALASNSRHIDHGSQPSFPRAPCGAGVEVLETVPVPSPSREDDLDQDTTISRSFRSAKKRSSSDRKSRQNTGGNASRSNLKKSHLTLNERFGTLSNPILTTEDGNVTAKSTASVQSKLSQVRILTSPPPNDEDISQALLTRTPSNAMRSTRKSLVSSKSVKSFLGVKSDKKRSSSRVFKGASIGEAKRKVITKVPANEINQEMDTSETNLENSDEDVFLKENPRTAQQLGQHYVTPVNAELVPRQLSQEQLLADNPQLVTRSSGGGGGKDWTNPRKDRKVGSPGNTATADYFIKQQTPQVLNIELEELGKDKARTEFVSRQSCVSGRRRVPSSAPARQGGDNLRPPQGAVVPNNHALTVKARKAYNPGYSESDLTSQSEDETRRQKWDRRGALEPELPQGFDVSPPVLDLSQVVSSISGTAAVSSAPLASASALSTTNPSPLQYSSISFSQSDMSLVVSSPTNYTASQSSHPVSLDWDNYASDPHFQNDNFPGNIQ